MTYEVCRLETEEQLRCAKHDWAKLLAQAHDVPIFLTWEWISCWWRHWQRGAKLWVLAAYDKEGELAGLLPLMLLTAQGSQLAARRLTFVGRGMVYPAHLDLLGKADEHPALAGAFMDYLNRRRNEWDLLDLGDLREGSALRSAMAVLDGYPAEKPGLQGLYIQLPEKWETYEQERLSAKRRKHLRRGLRRLSEDHPGRVEFRMVSDGAALDRALDALGLLSRERWHSRGLRSSFDDGTFVAFLREVSHVALGQGWLRSFALSVGGQIIAVDYGFCYGNKYYGYQGAFDSGWEEYGPGQLLFAHVIRSAIEEGVQELDLLRGVQNYKYVWTRDERQDAHVMFTHNIRGRLWLYGDRAYSNARTLAKQVLPEPIQNQISRLMSIRGSA